MAEQVTLGTFNTLQNSSIISTLNANNTLIENAFTDCVSLKGTAPNAMQSNLDMNSNQIINLPAPATLNSPVRLVDLSNAINISTTSSGVQVGDFGVVGDAIYKESAAYITATANGTTTLTTASTQNLVVGMNIANVSWHSFAAAAIANAGVIPAGTTVVSFVPNTSITLSNSIVTASNISLVAWSEVLTGTDNTKAIQNALDYAMQNNIMDIYFPSGQYLISDTLNLGWGNAFYELHLKGNIRAPYGGESGPGSTILGTTLFSTKTDRPMISIAGSRSTSIQGITMIGRGRIYTQFAQGFNNALSSDPLDWVPPNINPTGNNSGGIATTAPYACIVQDAYAGAQPTIHYPARTFPAWTGLSANYSAAYSLSTEILIEDCDMEGFSVNIASGLVNINQGDFMKIHRVFMDAGAYGVSINNSQSRNVEFRNIDSARYHTLFSGTNLSFGTGEIVGPIDNVGGGDSYQSFDFQNTAFSGPLLINNLYFENQVRIGNFVTNAFGSTITFNGGLFGFQSGESSVQLPGSYITSGQAGFITFNGSQFSGGSRIANLIDGKGYLFINGGFFSGAVLNNTSNALIQATNYCGGMLFGDVRFSGNQRNFLEVRNFQGSSFTAISGGVATEILDDEFNFFNSNIGIQTRIPMTQCGKNYTDTFGRRWRLNVTPEINFLGVGAFNSGPTYSNDQMSFGWDDSLQTAANVMENFAVGDMLYHIATKTLFVVTNIGAKVGSTWPITTIQQNNLKVNAAGTFVKNINPDPTLASGAFVIIKTGAVIPSVLEYGTFTSGSPNVTSISDGSGTSHMANNYVNGDIFFGLPGSLPGTAPYLLGSATPGSWPIAPGSTLSAVTDGTPGTLTLSKNALSTGVFPLFPYELR